MDDFITRLVENLGARVTGPMHLRLYMQPTMAVIFAVRAGLRDARDGQSPFFWSLFTSPGDRRNLLRQGWKDVGTVFILALVLDVIYQLVATGRIRPLETIIVAALLAFVPYLLSRGLVTRLARLAGAGPDRAGRSRERV